MSRAPLRTAVWALSSSIGLSIALLAVSSFPSGTSLPPPVSLTAGDPAQPVPESTDAPVLASDSARPEPQQLDFVSNRNHESPDPLAAPVVLPANPSIPVNVVSHPEESALAIGLEEAFNPVAGNGEFIELPPPPEFNDFPHEQTESRPSVELDELIGRMQTNFDDLHGEFDRLRHQFTGLQSQFTDELTAVQSSHGDVRRVLTELLESANARDQPPPRIEFDVTLLLMPRRGNARDGALKLMSRNLSGMNLSIHPEIANGVHWATCPSSAATLTEWLQLHAEAQIERRSTLHLEQHSVAEVDLARSPARGMTQARGTQVLERIIRLPVDGSLMLRAGTTPGERVDVELRWESTRTPASDDDWHHASFFPGGTLVLTAVLDEEYRSLDQVPSAAPAPASRQSAVAEMVALLQPRLLRAPTPAAGTLDVAAPLPLLIEESTTR